ncbi:Tat pathway signal sequence domain protein [Solimonas marina]|uniref:Tat pathway signal sequence domain protein n=1 Tax=Solimonas marina TaxID=2714601 RepID=A0A970B7N7_9GAMM|nr:Tat pathway signal sequence domain protein [Solimonas marina]NKF24098.1 Tat pathway signal sequence domain protein [Solimonas marina]
MAPPLNRRDFVKGSAIAASMLAMPAIGTEAFAAQPKDKYKPRDVALHWLDGGAPTATIGTTWGVSWPQGMHARGTDFTVAAADGQTVPVQSWPLAVWPDGTLKWSAHAIGADAGKVEQLKLKTGRPAKGKQVVSAKTSGDRITVDTGVIRCKIARKGSMLIESIERDGQPIVRGGHLVCQTQSHMEIDPERATTFAAFTGQIDEVTVEQSGPVRAVVRINGQHRQDDGSRSWLPFVIRLYFYAGSDAVRVMHTIVYDGDENKDFIRGLGLRFDVAMQGELYDRHVRYGGEGGGVFAEAVRGLTGLRRDPGEAVRQAQIDGRAVPPLSTFPDAVSKRLQYVPAFGDWSLRQTSCDAFEVRKRTKAGYVWLESDHGHRASGMAYVGTPKGGAAFGIRNFWQSYPAQLDVRGATGDEAQVTMWLWSPDAMPMDMRFYHDDMGEKTYAEQLEALQITYEDYEPGFSRPIGVARTSEMTIWTLPATPTRERFVELGNIMQEPPLLAAAPEHLVGCGVFGRLFSVPDRTTASRDVIETRLAANFDFYRKQVDERRWYGYWNFGDVMHTYDEDRHTWRYDVGGFAWDNSELSTDLWLWYYYLRTGRADVFRFAEAMTRHTGEVDVHHVGPFAPLGSRHNVVHWGCSAKQMRISTAANRRFYYYLTADERVGDLMREQVEAVRTLRRIQPGRKVESGVFTATPVGADHPNVNFGTDWGAVSAAWLTEWERTGDPKIRDRLLASMRTIAAQPYGFFTGAAPMNLDTGAYDIVHDKPPIESHLSAVFGLVEICAELVEMRLDENFTKAWLQYCRLFNAPAEAQKAELGHVVGPLNLQQGHSRLTAFAAWWTHDTELAQRAWKEFYAAKNGQPVRPLEVVRVEPPAVIKPVDEAPGVSTNLTNQFGLAAMQCLALVGGELPPNGEPA